MMSRFRPGSQPRTRTIVLVNRRLGGCCCNWEQTRCYWKQLCGPEPEQLYDSRGPIPNSPRLSSEKSSRKPAETLARDPEKARSRPRTRTNLRLQGPEQTPNTASSPRTGCVVLFYRILLILNYILCLMFDNVYIWCYVYHA